MKFARAKTQRPVPVTVDELRVAKRLSKVAARMSEEKALYPSRPDAPERVRIRRLFWTPDEL